MTDAFRIEVEQWLRGAAGPEHERQTLAAVRIQVGDLCITRAEDLEAKTVRDSAHLSAYRLAYWLMEHWWRLRWEPEAGTDDPDWQLSHRLAAVGAGYVWPPLTLSCDGESMRLTLHARHDPRGISPVRYLEHLDALVPAAAFERAIDAFVAVVLARLDTLGLADTDLAALWAEVARERQAPDLARTRRLEALLGIDPDESDDGLVDRATQYDQDLGPAAVDEVAAAAKGEAAQALETARSLRGRGTIQVRLANREELARQFRRLHRQAQTAWQLGEALADHGRRIWGLGNEPIDNSRLAGIADAPASLLTEDQSEDTGPALDGAGLRDGQGGSAFRAMIRSSRPTNRRFQLARLLADDIIAADTDTLLPLTRAKTARQKLQRAFAAGLLCPYDALRDMLPARPDDEDMEAAARRFEVSPLLVRTMLVNKGVLSRERLSDMA
jgi:hypothetical protein